MGVAEPDRRAYVAAASTAPPEAEPHVGTAMFYSGNEADGGSGVVPAGGDTRAVLRITRIVDDTSSSAHLRVSPDRRRIAFDSDRDGMRGVYVGERDGTSIRKVSGEGFAARPSWSPDSGTLAFVRADPAQPDVWNIWTLDLALGELRQITRHETGKPQGASWFPDGARLAYCHDDRLIVRDLRSNTERVYPSPRPNGRLRSAAVAPDGGRIVFHVERDGAWLLELPEGSMRRVLEDPSAGEYTWSQEGDRFAYYSANAGGWGVWVMAPR